MKPSGITDSKIWYWRYSSAVKYNISYLCLIFIGKSLFFDCPIEFFGSKSFIIIGQISMLIVYDFSDPVFFKVFTPIFIGRIKKDISIFLKKRISTSDTAIKNNLGSPKKLRARISKHGLDGSRTLINGHVLLWKKQYRIFIGYKILCNYILIIL